MTDCNLEPIRFPSCKGRLVEAGFSGGAITSDGGAVLLRQADRMLGLTDRVTRALTDPRRKASCRHSLRTMVRQRVYALALGYEDLNDHDELRSDPALQTAVDADEPLAGASTLCRLENRMGRAEAVRLHEALLEQFIASFARPPRRLVLDFDATDDPVHGMQEGRFFHGYYDRYCFLPLYVFCGDRLLAAYLRPGKSDGARHAWAVLALLVKRLRQVWPKVKIVFRGDGGFCRPRMLSWCERNDVDYVVGIARNAALAKKAKPITELAAMAHEASGKKVRVFDEFPYAAKTWRRRSRRVIVKAEHCARGANPRYIVTSLKGAPQWLYDKLYCARGDMENRIKEQQLDLFSDRTSCHAWWPNQYRLLLSAMAYVLLEAIRRIALAGSALANAYVGTIRLKLLKIGAVVLRNTRRVRLLLSGSYPRQALFHTAAARLKPG